jgi:hypothetical protein
MAPTRRGTAIIGTEISQGRILDFMMVALKISDRYNTFHSIVL